MSKTPPIDVKTMYDYVTDGDGGGDRADIKNPLADLASEFEDFSDLQVSPNFKSLKEVTPETDGKNGDAPVPTHAPKQVKKTPPATLPRNTGMSDDDGAETRAFTEAFEMKSATSTPVRPSENPAQESKTATVDEIDDQIAIPPRASKNQRTRTELPAGSAFTSEAIAANAKSEGKERRSRFGLRGMMAAAAVLVAVVGTGYFYVQGTQSAHSEAVVYSVPVFDDEPDVDTLPAYVAEEKSIDPQVEIAAVAPITAIAPVATAAPSPISPSTVPAAPLGFNDKLTAEFNELEGQSLLDLATGVPLYPPSANVPDAAWSDVSCGGCHSFDQADLCEQGAYYFNHDKARITRIQHPYGGGFKTKLMEWAEGGCL